MKIRNLSQILRAPEDGGAGGTAAAPPAGLVDLVLPTETPPTAADGGQGAKPPGGTDTPPATPPKPSRPDWMPEQFWDAEKGEARLEALARSNTDLRTKLAQAKPAGGEAPPASADAYTLPAVEGLPEGMGGADDPVWKDVRAAAHEAGVTQAQLNKIAGTYLKHIAAQTKEQGPAQEARQQEQLAAELGKLGPDAKAIVTDVAQWIRGLHAGGAITADEMAAFASMSTAAGITLMAKLRARMQPGAIPLNALQDGAMTQADAERMLVEGFAKKDDGQVARAKAELAKLAATKQLRLA